jgi:hypothetical protein
VGQRQFYPNTFPQAMKSLFGSYLADTFNTLAKNMAVEDFLWNTEQLVRIQK